MKKIILLLTISIFVGMTSFAKEVNLATAMSVARNFYSSRALIHEGIDKNSIKLSLAFKRGVRNSDSKTTTNEVILYYIFNVNGNDGFVIIAGDDIVTPVLGYGNTGNYNGNNLPPAFVKWLENYKEQIQYAQEEAMEPTTEIVSLWRDLISNNVSKSNSSNLQTVNPLCTTTWDQQPYYNEYCPYDPANTNNQHCVTGCPATAMAQIMKYWNYPTSGSGFHSYNHPAYGTLSANYGATTYNWGAMPNNVSSSNSAVATLMLHCGISVDMQYGPNLSAGYVIINSPTPTANCEYAYKKYFGYDSTTLQGLKRSNYSTTDWKTLLKNDLDNSRPLQYAGFGSGGGHTFVCDGYDVGDFFHMNWGWGGAYDGFFTIDALNPGGVGTGGGTGGFNSSQQAVIGIKPALASGNSTIDMYSSITVSPNPINFASPFTVNADVINNGTSSFSGDFCAAIFTAAGDFVDFVQILSTNSSPLLSGYHYNGGLTFSSSGILSVPGSYFVGIFYRSLGGNWKLSGDGFYTNPISVNINSPVDYIQQYSGIVTNPATFIQGQAATVHVNIINDNFVTYYGQYKADLYDLNGNFVQTIGTYNETTGLPPGYSYLAPYIPFTTTSITAAPGTYILAILELESGSSNWYLIGGQYFSTPVNIDVVAPPLAPDIYENNNTQSTAYTLPLNWVNNNAHPLTTGSNIHIDTDYDFYKLNLAVGYNYYISARAHDSYNSGNGNVYTADVLWSYNSGSAWSSAYDDVMQGNINVYDGGTVTFQVAPFFIGNTGTYLFDISINRGPTAGITEIPTNNSFEIFPNPASDYISVKKLENCHYDQWRIYNSIGQTIKQSLEPSELLKIDVADLPNGIFFLEAIQNDKVRLGKFVIDR
ncbi:MAG: C10 family peptidase [Bacteroidota bacterium]